MSKLVDSKRGGKINQFVKGESGNPNGRPKGSKNRATILKELLDTLSEFQNPVTKSKEKMEVEKAMDLAIIGKALKGDVAAWREVKDTVYGKNTDKQELDLKGELTLTDYNKEAEKRLMLAEEAVRKRNE